MITNSMKASMLLPYVLRYRAELRDASTSRYCWSFTLMGYLESGWILYTVLLCEKSVVELSEQQ